MNVEIIHINMGAVSRTGLAAPGFIPASAAPFGSGMVPLTWQ
jgi:hypothetical protein